MNIEPLKERLLAKMDDNVGNLEALERYSAVLHRLIDGDTQSRMTDHTISLGVHPDEFPDDEEFQN